MKDIKFEKRGDRYVIMAVLENGQKVEREFPCQAVDGIMKVMKLTEIGACEYLAVNQWRILDQVPPPHPAQAPVAYPPPEPSRPPRPPQAARPPPPPPPAPKPPKPSSKAPETPAKASGGDGDDLLSDLLDEIEDTKGAKPTKKGASTASTATDINKDSNIHIKPTGDYYDRKVNKETKAKPYEKWDYTELRAEVKDRELSPKSMKTDTLIIALREDDKKRKK